MNRSKSKCWFLITILFIGLQIPVLAHNYAAPFLYLSGIFSPTDEPVDYPAATDAELAYLTKMLTDQNANIRAIAAGALGQTKSPKAVEPLLLALSDKDEDVRMNAAMAFFHIKDKRCIEPLTQMLSNGDHASMGAYYSLIAQGNDGIRRVIDTAPIAESHHHESPYAEIAEGLVLSKGKGAINWATDVLKASDTKLHPVAVCVLDFLFHQNMTTAVSDAIMNRRVADRLKKIAQVDHSECSFVAAELLGQPEAVNENDPKSPAKRLRSENDDTIEEALLELQESETKHPELAKHLIPLLKQPKFEVPVALLLAQHKDPAAMDTMIQLLKTNGPNQQIIDSLHSYGQAAAEKMLGFLSDPSFRMKFTAVQFFKKYDNPLAVDALMSLLQDPSPGSRTLAMSALVYHTDARASSCYLQALKDGNNRTKRLGCLGIACHPDPSASEMLVPLLKDEDRYIRTCAATALGQLGDNRGSDVILEFFNSHYENDPEVDLILASAIRAAGKLKDKRMAAPIIETLTADVSTHAFEDIEADLAASRSAKIESLRFITGQDFGYDFYRWMAWSIEQGNKAVPIFEHSEHKHD